MSIIASKTERRERKCGCHGTDPCVEPPQETQIKIINPERTKYCEALSSAAGDVHKWQTSKSGEKTLYERKKCNFLRIEENHRRYRNTQICLGTELVQTTEIIKDNVKQYVEWGNKLSGLLKDVFKGVKEAKVKMKELSDAAQTIDHSKKDNCFDAAWDALNCRTKEKCNPDETAKEQSGLPDKCNYVCQHITDIVCMSNGLFIDINSIFKSSSEVIGIQVFSNIGTLDPIQKSLAEKAKAFDGYLLEVSKARESDLKKAQETLVKSVQETTNAYGALYAARSTFEGLKDTTEYLCCPPCECTPKPADTMECGKGRLSESECCICKICGKVQATFCQHETATAATSTD